MQTRGVIERAQLPASIGGRNELAPKKAQPRAVSRQLPSNRQRGEAYRVLSDPNVLTGPEYRRGVSELSKVLGSTGGGSTADLMLRSWRAGQRGFSPAGPFLRQLQRPKRFTAPQYGQEFSQNYFCNRPKY